MANEAFPAFHIINLSLLCIFGEWHTSRPQRFIENTSATHYLREQFITLGLNQFVPFLKPTSEANYGDAYFVNDVEAISLFRQGSEVLELKGLEFLSLEELLVEVSKFHSALLSQVVAQRVNQCKRHQVLSQKF